MYSYIFKCNGKTVFESTLNFETKIEAEKNALEHEDAYEVINNCYVTYAIIEK